MIHLKFIVQHFTIHICQLNNPPLTFFICCFQKKILQNILELSFHCSRCWTKFSSKSSKVITLLQPIRYFQNAIKENEDLVTAFLKHCYRFCFDQSNAIPSSFHFVVVCIDRWIQKQNMMTTVTQVNPYCEFTLETLRFWQFNAANGLPCHSHMIYIYAIPAHTHL